MSRLGPGETASRGVPSLLAALALAGALAASSCSSSALASRPGGVAAAQSAPPAAPRAVEAYPRARFVVLSDIHVYDPPEYSPTAAQAAALEERPLYGRSLELFREAVSRAIELRPDFVLLPGDLTKDGELPSHESVLRELGRLSAAGLRVFVVPGNHDIENPRARTYEGGKLVPLPSPKRADFARLYEEYGYGAALSRDADSLSYVAQLLPGLRLLALDPFRRPARPDPLYPEPASSIDRGTMSWIRNELERARSDGEAVIVMSHLSILEHFEGQAEFFPTSLAKQRGELASLLASQGVELAFTGHFHIQDVTRAQFSDGRALYDIATGALAYYPMPYRLVEIGPAGEGAAGASRASIRSFRLTDADAGPFAATCSSRDELERWTELVLEQKLRRAFVPRSEAAAIASSFARAYLALADGDESPGPGDDVFPEVRSLTGKIAEKRLAPLLKSLWRDLPPADNELEIDLGGRGAESSG